MTPAARAVLVAAIADDAQRSQALLLRYQAYIVEEIRPLLAAQARILAYTRLRQRGELRTCPLRDGGHETPGGCKE
jgi:hypothetical protein